MQAQYNVEHSVYFDTDEFLLTKTEQTRLQKLISSLSRDNVIQIEIYGFCDDRGGENYNLILSQNRANSIKSIFNSSSFFPEKISTVDGKGELLLNIIDDKELNVIPNPVFEPSHEENINKASSISYEVKEGDYIQVISPTGRQCSDFVAFDTRKLEKGIEKGLDWQTTRTFMGNTFPGPGLFSKFYDTDHEPLVEVIRDTVGKHDTFNLACTSKYYEDAGYFGHANCSDNLSESMSKYGLQKQKRLARN